MIDLLQNQFAEALANAFLHSLWQGAVVVVVLKLLSSTGILETARSKYMAYFLGLCTIFVSCAVGVFLSLNTHAPTWEYMDQVLAYESINLVTQKAVPIFTVRDLGLIVWIVGVVVIGSKHTIELFKLYRIRNTSHIAPRHWQDRVNTLKTEFGVKARVLLVTTSRAVVPFTMGILKPVIVIPTIYFTNLTPGQIEAIIRHELAHIQRFDFAYNMVQVVIESLLFFNPAVWILGNEIRKQREYCCDDMVTARPSLRKDYLEALYRAAVITSQGQQGAVSLFENQSELIMRVQRMCNQRYKKRKLPISFAATTGMVLLLGAFTFYSINSYAANSDDKRTYEILEDEFTPEEHLETLRIWGQKQLAEATYLEALELAQMPVDTHPPSPRMVELEKQMEELAEQMEEIAEEMEEAMEEGLEAELEKIEALSEEIEETAEKYEEEIEARLENSPEMQRIEELSALIEARAEELEAEAEALDEELIARIEAEIEAKEESYENYSNLSEEERTKLNSEMQALTAQMQEAMRGVQEAHRNLMQDEEFLGMQEEMSTLSLELSKVHEEVAPMHEEMQVLHEQIAAQQEIVHKQMQESMRHLEVEMHELQQQMELLHKEFAEEYKKWEKEHSPNDD